MIRRAEKRDIPELENLIYVSFGTREDATSFKTKTNDYIVYEEDNEIVAMTGLVWSDEYTAWEIAWTCTHPEYRNKGIMHEMFNHLLKEQKERVYCSCWHIHDREHINLYKLMKDFHFKQVIPVRVAYKNGHNCHRDSKSCRCYTGGGCECIEELYLREAN